jgi:hypothetical protein
MTPKEIILRFEEETYSLFTSSTNENVLFGEDYEPKAIDIPLEANETFQQVLYNSPIYFVIIEMKELLKENQVDVSLEIPFLDVGFDQESLVLRQKSLADFVAYQESLSLHNNVPNTTLEILMTKVTLFFNP